MAYPSVWLVSLGVWWISNTVSHLFLHSPHSQRGFFNRSFSLYLSIIVGIPQTLWRQRHLAHHTGRKPKILLTNFLVLESFLIVLLCGFLICYYPVFYFTIYLPGFLIGLLLCQMQGYFEHWRGTTSYYGMVYNRFMLNDGYHVEHHANPILPWKSLSRLENPISRSSAYPPLFRWMELCSLDFLERLVLNRPWLQRFMITQHERALKKLLPEIGSVKTIAIVGGGLFPRTALILKKLLPQHKIIIIDHDAENLEIAKRFLTGVEFRNEHFIAGPNKEFDLVVLPLAFDGDREKIYSNTRGNRILIHDWIWNRGYSGVIISPFLLKRLNLIG